MYYHDWIIGLRKTEELASFREAAKKIIFKWHCHSGLIPALPPALGLNGSRNFAVEKKSFKKLFFTLLAFLPPSSSMVLPLKKVIFFAVL